MGLDLMLVLWTARLCSLNLSAGEFTVRDPSGAIISLAFRTNHA